MTHREILDDRRQPVNDLREHIPAVFEGYGALSSAVLGEARSTPRPKIEDRHGLLMQLGVRLTSHDGTAVSDATVKVWRPGRDTTNATDEIFSTGGEPAVVDVAPDGDGYRAAICLVLPAAKGAS